MGSEYIIVDDKHKRIQLTLCEMSNRFSLMVSIDSVDFKTFRGFCDGEFDITEGLTPEQLVEIAFKFIQTAAYWAGGQEMRASIAAKLADVCFLDGNG